MKWLLAASSLLWFSCASAPTPSSSPTPQSNRSSVDILITGGTVLTMAGPNIDNGAVAIRDGVIIAVGPSADLSQRFAANETIDARGSAILPGFVNAHTHAPMALFRGIADDRELMDWLQNFIFPAEGKNVDEDFVKWGTRLAAAEMIRSGTTTFADMYYFEAVIGRETRQAGLRAVLGETVIDFPAPDNKTWDAAIASVRAFAAEFRGDSLITAAIAPHAPYTVSADHLRQVRALATELQIPILIHVAETQNEIEQVTKNTGKRPVEYLESLDFLASDVLAAHCIWITPEEIATLKRHDVACVHNPESNMMLSSGTSPVPAMIAAGMTVGLGTDGPAGSNNNLDMIEEMGSAARLQKAMQKDPRALSARQVLEMATIGGARALDLDSKIGTLEEGKRADVIVVQLDNVHTQPIYSIESALVYAANGRDVSTTIVDGKILMQDRRLLTIDEKETMAKAAMWRDRIVQSLVK